MTRLSYERDPAEIYRQSFATIENEVDFSKLPNDMVPVAVRLIHACGMTNIVDDLAYSQNAVAVGKEALAEGCSIFTDVEMVKSGIIQKFLPADNQLTCSLNDAEVPELAKQIGNTRSAAAVERWGDKLEGAIVVIGNAPTALFHLFELLDEGAPKPTLIIGIPVGFVGAVESKIELAENSRGCEFITVHGRRGGSAIAAAVLNAIAVGVTSDG